MIATKSHSRNLVTHEDEAMMAGILNSEGEKGISCGSVEVSIATSSQFSQLRQSCRSRGERLIFLANRKARVKLTQVLVGFLIKKARRDARDSDFANEPLGELDVVFHLLGRDAAPIDHDEVAPLRLENFETGFLQRPDHHVAPGLIIGAQVLEKLGR